MPVEGSVLGNRSRANVGQPKTIVAGGDDWEQRYSGKQNGHRPLQA
jgi:hypothetical protein